MDVINDDRFPQVLTELRTTVPEAGPPVPGAAFGWNPDGTAKDHRKRPNL
ncbi:hypothetical protein [Streptomyces sp. NPDC056255]